MRRGLAAARLPFLGLVLGLVLGAGCKKPSAERVATGLGNWDVPHATARQVKDGRCDPVDLNDGRRGVWCYGLPGPRMGSQPAQVDAYFSDGTAAGSAVGSGANLDAPLVELQFSVRACTPTEVDRYLRDRVGIPVQSGRGRAFWENRAILVAADLPDAAGACTIYVYPRREQAEYDKRKAATPAN